MPPPLPPGGLPGGGGGPRGGDPGGEQRGAEAQVGLLPLHTSEPMARFLENEIHKTNLKLMEGETIKKKYTSILDMLRKERLTFSNQWENLEAQIRKQDEEMERLKNTQKVSFGPGSRNWVT